MKFKELSLPCKVGIIGGWFWIVYSILMFMVGFILGIAEYLL